LSDLIIKIGDDDIDLKVDEVIAITKQAAKVGDFSTVLADGTNEVKIPLTPRNKTILGNSHIIETDSEKPYSRLDATLIQEGYQTIQDGYAIVKSSANDFSLQLIGGNASFFDLIKDLELRDLELSEYDHFWTNGNAFIQRNRTEGLIYAVFEQGMDENTMRTYSSTPNDRFAVHTDLLFPSFYVKTLVEKIFSEQGYSFVTDLSTEDIYDKAVLFCSDIGNRGEDMSYHDATVRNFADQTTVSGDFPDGETFRLFADATVDAPTSSYTSGADFLTALQGDGTEGSRFNLTDSCSLTLNLELEIENPPSPNGTVQVTFYVDHTTEAGIVTENLGTFDAVIGTNNYSLTVDIDVQEYEDENYFAPRFTYFTSTPTFSPLIIKEDSTYSVSNVTLLYNSEVSSAFPFNYLIRGLYLPDMKQGEFLKELARMYQWVFDVDERTKTVTAKRFDQIKESIPEAVDLSDKLHTEDITINYGLDGFAQTNALRYQEDDETKYDAVGYIDVADTTLKAEKNYVQMSDFAATSTRLRFETVNAPYVPIFEEGAPANGLTDRILLVRRSNPFDENVNFYRAGSSPENLPTDDLTFAYFAEAGNNDSLDFPTLISRFYQTVIDMNVKGKTVDCKLNLNIKDVQNYDPFKPVYIEHFGNYFYWEKLSNYVKDKLTKVKLIKI
jgi:hypothetical protein